MILIDMQQCMIANLHMQLKGHTNAELDENMLRHMILNSIRYYNSQFREKYGEMIIACDDRHTWRKDVFPYYKFRRKKTRDESELDWTTIFESMHKIRDELTTNFPYRVIIVEGAEADDVIGTLCHTYQDEPNLIISGDKDFRQLQKFSNVSQYDPRERKLFKEPHPSQFLFEHIMRGDFGDDIPNVLSPDDTFVTGTRQKTLTAKRIEKLDQTSMQEWPEDLVRNYHRNELLIDLSQTPNKIKCEILDKYEIQQGKVREKIFPFLMKHRLINLLDHISDF